MDYISPLQNKRRHEGDSSNWDCQSKRLCSGLGHCGTLKNGAVTDSPMDTWETPQEVIANGNLVPHNVHNMQVYAQGKGAGQCCLRCMAGEPGHINHIMGY